MSVFAHLSVTLLFLFALSSSTLKAAVSQIIDNASINSTFLIDNDEIDGNPLTNRHRLFAASEVTISVDGPFETHQATYRLSYQLIDESGTPVELNDADPTTIALAAATPGQDVDLTTFALFPATPNPSETLTFQLPADPENTLVADEEYRLQLTLQRESLIFLNGNPLILWTPVGETFTTAPRKLPHFTNTASPDAPLNVRISTETLSWEKTYALASSTTGNSFTANLTASLYRWDDFTAARSLAPVTITYDYDLIDSLTGNPVALADDGVITESLNTFNYNLPFLGINSPSFVALNRSHDIRPLGQLDSVAKRYQLSCSISHLETNVPQVTFADGSFDTLPDQRLLHFNGTLNHGTRTSSFDDFGAPAIMLPSLEDELNARITIAANAGSLSSRPDLTFSGGPVDVRLLPNGDATLQSGSLAITSLSGDPVTASYGKFSLIYPSAQLTTAGFRAVGAAVQLPQGLCYFENLAANRFGGESEITFPNAIPVSDELTPASPLTLTLPPGAAFSDEAHPLLFNTGGRSLTIDSDRINISLANSVYVHIASFALLQFYTSPDAGAFQIDPKFRDRPSNDRYLKNVSSSDPLTVDVAADGTSRISLDLTISPDSFETHFPKQAAVSWTQTSAPELRMGEFANNSRLQGAGTAIVSYYQTCPGDECTENIPPVALTHSASGGEFNLIPGGGLQSNGTIPAHQLQWGKRSPTLYTHRTDAMQQARFHSPGYHLYAADVPNITATSDLDRLHETPARLLLSDASRTSNDHPHYPGEAAHRDGLGDAPGLNFDATNGQGAASRLAGSTSDFGYTLIDAASNSPNGGAKYYIREGGVSGRQCATAASGTGAVSLSGFPTLLTNFQVSFLDNDNERPECQSWIDGSVEVQGFSNWDQGFTGLRIDCYGNPGELTLDDSSTTNKSLTYWNSSFDLQAMSFASTLTSAAGVCPKTYESNLIVDAKLFASHIEQPLYGKLAFTNSGNLSTTASPISGVTSTLGTPASIPLSSPSEPYLITPVSALRFSNPEAPDSAASPIPATGFVSFVATINIPYFQDLYVQVLTSARSPLGANGRLYLTPGFELGGQDWFTNTAFDGEHRGFPDTVSLDEFRNPRLTTDGGSLDPTADLRNEPLLLQAEQKLFGLIDLKYPLKWDFETRRFSSIINLKEKLLVATMEHEVEYLDGQFANVSFGAKYDGLPQLKLSNFLNNQLDAAAETIAQIISNKAKKQIDKGLVKLEEILEDTLEKVIDPLVDAAATPDGPICQTYDFIQALNTEYDQATDTYADFRTDLEELLVPHKISGGDPNATAFIDRLAPGTNIDERWNDAVGRFQNTSGQALTVVTQVDDALEEVLKGINIFVQGVDTAAGIDLVFSPDIDLPDGDSQDFQPGILFQDENGDYQIVRSLVKRLLPELLPDDIAAIVGPLLEETTDELNDQLNVLLEKQKPTLDQVRSVLIELRTVITKAREKLKDARELITKLQEIGSQLSTQALLNPAGERAWKYFQQREIALGIKDIDQSTPVKVGKALAALSKEEFVDLIKTEIKNQILASSYIQKTKHLLKQLAYDLNDQITSSIQTALAEVGKMMRDLVKESVDDLEEQINPLIGKVSDFMGSGELTGYAEVNGDSLRKLRVDGALELKIPDEMKLNVYLEILCVTSEDNFTENGCILPGDKAVEVRIGALGLAVEWISEITVDVGFKLTLKDEPGGLDFPTPNGVGGFIEMKSGTLDFQGFEVSTFGATIGIGSDECYLGAKAMAKFSNYKVGAGIFFGRTCTIDPLLLVDPDIASVVDPGTPFTGAYVYGEVWLPISELVLGVPASCMFRIDAGVGAGAFYFVEGATYGGKMLLGVSGEALCMVNVKGQVKMILASQAGDVRGSGTGKFSAKVGKCPFCLKFNKSVKIGYTNGSWSFN